MLLQVPFQRIVLGFFFWIFILEMLLQTIVVKGVINPSSWLTTLLLCHVKSSVQVYVKGIVVIDILLCWFANTHANFIASSVASAISHDFIFRIFYWKHWMPLVLSKVSILLGILLAITLGIFPIFLWISFCRNRKFIQRVP